MARHGLRIFGALVVLLFEGAHGKATDDKTVAAQLQTHFVFVETQTQTSEEGEEQEVEVSRTEKDEVLPIYEGEDAASAAQRNAEEHNVFDGEKILEIARSYKDQLSALDDFSSPKDLILRTGGAYLRRADEAIKEKRFAASAADCLRALMRPGLDPTATEPMMKKLGQALLRMQRIREMAEDDARLEEEKYAAQRQEADLLAKEWSVLLAQDGEMWKVVDNSNADAGSQVAEDAAEVAGTDLTLNKGGVSTSVRLQVREGEDASHAAFHFCAAHDIHSFEEVQKSIDLLQKDMEKKKYKAPEQFRIEKAADHLQKGQSHQDNLLLGHAGAHYARGLQAKGLTDEEKEDLSTRLKDSLVGFKSAELFRKAWPAKNYQGVVDALKDIPAALRSDLVQLILARSYSHLGKTKDAIAAITSLLNKADKGGDWKIEEPRLIAAISGAVLAMRVGDIDKAKRIYQIVLRNEPEQPHVKERYKVLRKFMKILTDIEELLRVSKNHDAVKVIDITNQLLEKVLGKEGAANAGTRLLLFECKAKSAMTFHDDAIEACNTAIEQFENHDNPDPRRIAEAYAWRAEANGRDNSFDDGVRDLQVSLTKNPNSREYKEQLDAMQEKKDEWNKSEDQRDRRGESLGNFYVNRPIKQMLELPDNIDELDKETKCKWLKSSFRKMSLRWHPDKAKGGKARAQRKSAEIGEGKGLLELQWGCKGKQGNRR